VTLPGLAALNARREWFTDPGRPIAENQGPHVLVFDDFYDDPLAVRSLGLSQPFFQYSPPLASQVGDEIAGRFNECDPRWFSTSLHCYHGQPVRHPQAGFRHDGSEVRERLARQIGERINMATWSSLGDGWNGAFHLQYAGTSGNSWSIHHHYKPGDVYPRGWSGLVYLSPDAPPASGTTLWRDRQSGRCVASAGAVFSRNADSFEQVFAIENRFNRLVLFRENVLHRAEPAFGADPDSGRLTQTFFFLSETTT